MFKAIAEYILRSRRHAMGIIGLYGGVILLLAEIMYFLPFHYTLLFCLSGAPVALVTLRHGTQAGAQVAGGGLVIVALLLALVANNPIPALAMGIAVWLPLWMAASTLRRTERQGAALTVLMGICAFFAVGMDWTMAEILRQWHEIPMDKRPIPMDETMLGMALEQAGMFLGVVLQFSLTISLFLARWWQDLLFNPGGFGREYRTLRLPWWTAGLIALLSLLILGLRFFDLPTSPWGEILAVVACAHVFQGLAVGQVLADRLKGRRWAVALLYSATLFLFPIVMPILVVVGIADTLIDLRGPLPSTEEPPEEPGDSLEG